jgi:hypothetical protein
MPMRGTKMNNTNEVTAVKINMYNITIFKALFPQLMAEAFWRNEEKKLEWSNDCFGESAEIQ